MRLWGACALLVCVACLWTDLSCNPIAAQGRGNLRLFYADLGRVVCWKQPGQNGDLTTLVPAEPKEGSLVPVKRTARAGLP